MTKNEAVSADDHQVTRLGRWAVRAVRQVVTGFGYLERVPIIGGLFTLAGNVVDAIGSLSGAIFGRVASMFTFRTSEAVRPAQQPTTVIADASLGGAAVGHGASHVELTRFQDTEEGNHADATMDGAAAAAALAGGTVAGACALKSRVGVLNSLGAVVTCADGIQRTLHEDTDWHKAQRAAQTAAEVTAVIGSDLAIKSALASGTGIAAHGGVAAVGAAALPFAVVAGVAFDLWGIHQCIETGIDTSRIYEAIDNSVKANTERLTNLKPMASKNYYLTAKSEHLRDAARTGAGNVDLTRVENIDKLRHAIMDARESARRDMNATSWFGTWRYFHFTEGQSQAHARYEMRKLDMHTCTAALEELAALEAYLHKAQEAKSYAAAEAQTRRACAPAARPSVPIIPSRSFTDPHSRS